MADLPEPKSRAEIQLAAILDPDITPPAPDTRLEIYLEAVRAAIAQGGGGYIPLDQGIENAGKLLAVGADGIVAPTEISIWSGGSY